MSPASKRCESGGFMSLNKRRAYLPLRLKRFDRMTAHCAGMRFSCYNQPFKCSFNIHLIMCSNRVAASARVRVPFGSNELSPLPCTSPAF